VTRCQFYLNESVTR